MKFNLYIKVAVLVFRKDGSYPYGNLSGWSITIGKQQNNKCIQAAVTSLQLFRLLIPA